MIRSRAPGAPGSPRFSESFPDGLTNSAAHGISACGNRRRWRRAWRARATQVGVSRLQAKVEAAAQAPSSPAASARLALRLGAAGDGAVGALRPADRQRPRTPPVHKSQHRGNRCGARAGLIEARGGERTVRDRQGHAPRSAARALPCRRAQRHRETGGILAGGPKATAAGGCGRGCRLQRIAMGVDGAKTPFRTWGGECQCYQRLVSAPTPRPGTLKHAGREGRPRCKWRGASQ